ncbi:MAG: DUF1223 domain-containing protein [Gammaproteobacteria bacterium]|nr:DUF1223 domain-containing protein [Gammaproteobacteria bacterium]
MKLQLQNIGKRLICLICCAFSLSSWVAADEIRLQSTVESVAVVELFTSHGCSSCPPADKWLRRFTNHKGLWSRVIPMAFHVDYWDYLGWKDQFSHSSYSERQRQYRNSGGVRSVYTPGFVVNGKEWRGWFRGNAPDITMGQKVGRLQAVVIPGQHVTAVFKPVTDIDHADITAHAAILGFGINSKIGGGENSGRELKQDFVVLGDSSGRISNRFEWTIPWPEINSTSSNRRAVVVWLSRQSDPTPIQAVAGWLAQQ